MGFEGTEVTPQIRKLISEHYIGSILLKASNLKCKSSITALLAYESAYVRVSMAGQDDHFQIDVLSTSKQAAVTFACCHRCSIGNCVLSLIMLDGNN